jgi:hypothetical protein
MLGFWQLFEKLHMLFALLMEIKEQIDTITTNREAIIKSLLLNTFFMALV